MKPEDCMAIALNRLTPADPATHRFTAQVTYRVLRVGDGELLLPDKNVVADSGDQVSDDVARTVVTELALNKASDILPGEITRAMRQNQRTEARVSTTSASEYLVRIDNVDKPRRHNRTQTGVAQCRLCLEHAVPRRCRIRVDHGEAEWQIGRGRIGGA